MVSIGGRLPSSRAALGQDPDPWITGLGIFDMTEFAWSDSYRADAAAYEQPKVVKDFYASSYQEPVWSNAALASVFGKLLLTVSDIPSWSLTLLGLSIHCSAPIN